MMIGISGNTGKRDIHLVIKDICCELEENGLDYRFSIDLTKVPEIRHVNIPVSKFLSNEELFEQSDLVISVGGDGTLLSAAQYAIFADKPVMGVNFGKLGFLTEIDKSSLKRAVYEIKNHEMLTEERMLLAAHFDNSAMVAVNDIVIDKGGWPKMIQMMVEADGEPVTSFSADGLIIATPTGSTGYSLSVGGPVVHPGAEVITLSPISPHTLTLRPMVLPGNFEVTLKVPAHPESFWINCDGQRVYECRSPFEMIIKKYDKPLKLVKTSFSSYFSTLRSKLLWGLDIRDKI